MAEIHKVVREERPPEFPLPDGVQCLTQQVARSGVADDCDEEADVSDDGVTTSDDSTTAVSLSDSDLTSDERDDM